MISRDPAVSNISSLASQVELNTIDIQTFNTDLGTRVSRLEYPEIIVLNTSTITPTASAGGKTILITRSSGAVQINIDASLNLNQYSRIDFIWYGAASSVTFSATGSPLPTLVGTPGTKLRTRYSAATLLCINTDEYILVGDLSA
jgi:hypothetical protein